ncbi:MAG: hypothetical protein ABUL60_27810 [Myxococcales bacterium]
MTLGCALAGFGCSAGGADGKKSGGDGGGLHLGTGDSASPGVGGALSLGGSLGLGGGLGNGSPFGCPTSVSGTVFDPAGNLPLYNVVVYVPSQPLEALKTGASCETCDGNFSGRPIAAAVSDAAGKFVLQLENVPQSDSIPLVIQVGKWRRQITLPAVTACADTPLADGTVRLPKDRTEGDLPKFAIVRGGSDALECLFLKIGVSPSEFTAAPGDERVHLYVNDGTKLAATGQMMGGGAIPLAGTLYSNLEDLMGYDAMFLACDGNGRSTYEDTATKYGPVVFSNIQKYADQGGRVFGSHYHNYWVRTDKFSDFGVTPYPPVATFASSQHGFDQDVTGDVDASFPKGVALRDWLVNVGASTTPGKLLIHDGEHTVDATLPGVSQSWITAVDPSAHHVVQYFSFTAPVGGTECGRMVFSDLHVAAGTGDSGKVPFPSGCTSTDLSPQEKALAFMLFDLSSCVQPETDDVKPPKVF